MLLFLDQLAELVEEVAVVVGAGAGFGVILDAEDRQTTQRRNC